MDRCSRRNCRGRNFERWIGEKMDVIIFGGQSNMQGQTECAPTDNQPVQGAFEFRFETNALQPLQHPVGENLWGVIAESDQQRGSLVPAFCEAYVKATGRKVAAVHAAKGATTIGEWLRGTQRYHYAAIKMKAALQKVQETERIGRIYYVWLQGESDALIQTTEEEYLGRLIAYKNDLKKDVGIHKFCIIKVGYFAATAVWLKDDMGVREEWDEAIQRAQERAAQTDEDFVMLTDICTKMSRHAEYINPQACGHYTNAGLERIGNVAGQSLARYAASK